MMAEPGKPAEHEGAPRARNEGDDVPGASLGASLAADDEHWHGYPGGEEAASYPVVDRGRYKLLLFLFLLAFLGTVIAIATRQSENLPRDERGFLPR